MEILKHFTSQNNNKLRLWMKNVNIVGEYAYATDEHILIRKKISKNQEQSDVPEHIPNRFKSIFDMFKVKFTLKSEPALTSIIKHKTDPVYANYMVECENCNSSGFVEYTHEYNGRDYTIEGECPACNGNCGTMVNWNKIVSYKYDSDLRVKIGDATFNPALIELILTTLGDIQVGFTREKIYFKSGEYEGVLIEYLSNDSCEIIELNLLK